MLDKPIKRKPVILCIMDGFGMRKENYGNAINQAKKPHLDDFFASYPFTEIDAKRKCQRYGSRSSGWSDG